MQHDYYDAVILGAGAAGLMCAIEAGKRERKVLVLDHANKPGKKILMSGGGRCNFTNLSVGAENFLSHNPHFCRSALSRYTPHDFIQLVEKHQIAYHEKTLGQLFCDNKSKAIVSMLLAECQQANVSIQLNCSIEDVKQTENGFLLKSANKHYCCESLVVATGGLSIPSLGASPFGYELAKQFDINVWPTRAGLVPFTLHEKDKLTFATLPGIAVDCSVSCEQHCFTEAMLFTHRGLSGPAMLQVSSYWQPGDLLTVNLLPQIDLLAILNNKKKHLPKLFLKKVLADYFPKRLIDVFLLENASLHTYSHEKLTAIVALFQHWLIKPNNTEGYRTAEVTLGGVDCNAVSSKTFEANAVSGLYFIGEVLDVSGWLGGYNFQWAWSSGFAAGQYI